MIAMNYAIPFERVTLSSKTAKYVRNGFAVACHTSTSLCNPTLAFIQYTSPSRVT